MRPVAPPRDHGGGIDAAVERWGGTREDWLDLSTGINPCPYPLPEIPAEAWTALPDRAAADALVSAARAAWQVPGDVALVAAPGASALIAGMPRALEPLVPSRRVAIPGPTYNEHAAAFAAAGWTVTDHLAPDDAARVLVHPNNPDGRLWSPSAFAPVTVIDESFCDVLHGGSLLSARPGTVVLKSFGKFWGLAGLRLGCALGDAGVIGRLADGLGPWPVSGPALTVGATALADTGWADTTRGRLTEDSARLDRMMEAAGATCLGGTSLFRLYDVGDAAAWQERLGRHRILVRVFPYAASWIRLGLPAPDLWPRLAAALA